MVTEKELLQLEYDKKQMQFAIDGTLIINKKLFDEQTPLSAFINDANFWICPFCLETSNKFIIENKGLIKCPNCLVCSRMKTLLFVKDCSNEQYARWVYEYRLSGFFQKINFEKWNKKMFTLGIAHEFWQEYRKLKGEDIEEPEPEFTSTEMNSIITCLSELIKDGKTKEEIIVLLTQNSIDYKKETFDYCFNEATLKVKHGVINEE